ncbi:SDR family NAD(P)-dependent oxidoreductase [Paenibacillus gansuensis]|uniref:SDR family NAD(P)-dependent oxidoreductase n=1 Tax=Paenibacillus gansuensis TaxID=306542 RepID=A0ABW5PJH2_9BACL
MKFDLSGKVALVTGASRGVGKGIALGLGECGATVYVTGRSTVEGQLVDGLGGTLQQTVNEVEKLGGRCIAIPCDHSIDEQTETVFRQIYEEQGRIDILVNNVWAGYQFMLENLDTNPEFTWEKPFWEQPRWRWDAMFQAGVRAHYVSSQLAARSMVPARSGLIVNISFWAAQMYMANVAYGVSKAATDKMVRDMAHELTPHQVAAVSLYPGLVRTEGVMRAAHAFDLSNSESPQFIGRAIAALASDPHILHKTGKVLIAADLALEYGFKDIDGKQPRPLRREDL